MHILDTLSPLCLLALAVVVGTIPILLLLLLDSPVCISSSFFLCVGWVSSVHPVLEIPPEVGTQLLSSSRKTTPSTPSPTHPPIGYFVDRKTHFQRVEKYKGENGKKCI